MTLAELIARLEAADPQQVVKHGFHNPHSYRGDYMDLAFEPATDVTVADMLDAARSALGEMFTGYKGGDFTMDGHTDCWLAEYGCLGETIGPLLLDLMLAAPAVPAGQAPATDRADVEPSDPTECSGDEGFCPEHGFHRHSLKQPGEPEPATDRAALRDRIAEVLAEADGWRWAPGFKAQSPTWHGYQARADAVLAELSAPTDRAAVLREAADFFRGLHATGTAVTAKEVEAELRRMAAVPAGQTPDTDQAGPSRRAGLRDGIAAAIADALKPRYGGPQHNTPGGLPLTATAEEVRLHRAQPLADAVLPVLYREWPWLRAEAEDADTDRAAVLEEAATRYETMLAAADTGSDPRYWTAIRDMAHGLRCMATEAPAVVSAVPGQTDSETADGARVAAFRTAANYVRGVSADQRWGRASISTALCTVSDEIRRWADELAAEQPAAGAQQPKEARP